MEKIANKCIQCIHYNEQEKRLKNKFYCALTCEEYLQFQKNNIEIVLKEIDKIKTN